MDGITPISNTPQFPESQFSSPSTIGQTPGVFLPAQEAQERPLLPEAEEVQKIETAPTQPLIQATDSVRVSVAAPAPYVFEQPQMPISPDPSPAKSLSGAEIPAAPLAEKTNQVSDQVSYRDAHIEEIDVTKVVPNPYQPRKVFDPEGIRELADSIREHGVIQPLVVTRTPAGFEIVVGERRFRASVQAGLAKVPAIVKETLGDQTKLEVALIENIQRRELNPIEEAQAYDRLIKTFNLTQDQVAKKVGKSRPSVTNTLRLLNLPAEIQRAVIEGRISEGHARAILGLPERERQLHLFALVLEQGLNVRQVEAKVRELTVKKTLDAAAPDPKLIAIESELRGKLGTQVKIQRQGAGGRITIEFFSDDELNEIIHKMSERPEEAGSGYFTV